MVDVHTYEQCDYLRAMPRLLVVHHSPTENVARIANADASYTHLRTHET